MPKNFGGPVIGTGPYYLFKGRNIREWPNGNTYETNAILQEEGIPGIDLTGLLPMTPPAGYHFRLWCSAIVPTCPTTTESLCGTLHDQHINIVFQCDAVNAETFMMTPVGFAHRWDNSSHNTSCWAPSNAPAAACGSSVTKLQTA